MLKQMLLLGTLISLMGCATSSNHPHYHAAKRDGTGYRELALDKNHYRVQFKLDGNRRNAAYNYALLRAAELSEQQGYEWFVVGKKTLRVIDKEDDLFTEADLIHTRRCGLLTCRNETQQLPSRESGFDQSYTIVLLDIVMGKGVRPEKKSFDAMEIQERLLQK